VDGRRWLSRSPNAFGGDGRRQRHKHRPDRGPIAGERGQRIGDLVEQRADLRAIVHLFAGQRRGHDLAGVGMDTEMELAPGAAGLGAMFLNQPLARTAQLQSRAVNQQVDRLSIGTAGMPLWPWHFQARPPPAQRCMVRHPQRQTKQADDGADEPFGLAEGKPEHRKVSAVRIARGEYQGWPPQVVRGAAAQAAIASSVNQTVKLPR
jgi:hypothetical protein